MYCQNCGKEIDDKAEICIGCGVRVGSSNNEDIGITKKLGKMGIPGFRSGKKWKIAIAIFGYFWIFIILLAIISGPPEKTPSPQATIKTVASVSTITPTPQVIVKELKQQNFSGIGKKITDEFYLQKGIAKIGMTHAGGRSNFIISLLDTEGNNVDTLANEIGEWEGQTAIRIERSGYYLMDVTADGSWTVVIQN